MRHIQQDAEGIGLRCPLKGAGGRRAARLPGKASMAWMHACTLEAMFGTRCDTVPPSPSLPHVLHALLRGQHALCAEAKRGYLLLHGELHEACALGSLRNEMQAPAMEDERGRGCECTGTRQACHDCRHPEHGSRGVLKVLDLCVLCSDLLYLIYCTMKFFVQFATNRIT